MNWKSGIISLLFLAFCGVSAHADSIKLTGTGGTTVGGVTVAPYYVQVNGVSTNLSVVCLDADMSQQVGEEWDISINSIGDPDTDFFPSTDKYKAAAVLWTWMQQGTVSYGAGNYAIWNLFRPDFSISPGGQEAMDAQASAINLVSTEPNLNFARIVIYTPENHGSSGRKYQEFMGGDASVPEPSTFVLLGSVLTLAPAVMRLRRRGQSASA